MWICSVRIGFFFWVHSMYSKFNWFVSNELCESVAKRTQFLWRESVLMHKRNDYELRICVASAMYTQCNDVNVRRRRCCCCRRRRSGWCWCFRRCLQQLTLSMCTCKVNNIYSTNSLNTLYTKVAFSYLLYVPPSLFVHFLRIYDTIFFSIYIQFFLFIPKNLFDECDSTTFSKNIMNLQHFSH